MMTFTIEAPLKLLSLNQAYKTTPQGIRALSKEYKAFKREIENLMMSRANEFKRFNDSFIPKEHEIHASLIFGTPNLYTKEGTISKNSCDIGNVEKPLVDCVLKGSIDDSQIITWILKKKYHPNYMFSLTFKIVSREDQFN